MAAVKSYPDITVSPFSSNGGPNEIDTHWLLSSSYDFLGIDDDVQSSEAPVPHTALFTYYHWFKVEPNAGNQYLHWYFHNGSTNGFYIFMKSNGQLQMDFLESAPNQTRLESSVIGYDDGEWHLLGISINGNTQEMQVDGVPVDTVAQVFGAGLTTGINATARDFHMGSAAGGSFLEGSVARFFSFDVADDSATMTAYFAAEFAAIVGWGVILDTPEIAITDMSTLTQTGVVTYASDGKDGSAAVFNGSGGRVSRANLLGSTADRQLTFCFLANLKSGTGNRYVFDASNLPYSLFVPADDKVNQAVVPKVGGISVVSAIGPTLDTDIPTLMVFTCDDSVDGAQRHRIYLSELADAVTQLDANTIPATFNTGFDDPFATIWFGATSAGTFPMTSGSWIGQVRSFQDKYIDALAAKIIEREYTTGEFGVPNQPPVVDNPIADQATPIDNVYDFTFPLNTFSDPDGDPLTYLAQLLGGSPLPPWLTFTPLSRNFNGTPLVGDVATLDIEVIALDPDLLSVSDVFELDVYVNQAPVVDNPISNQSILEGTTYNFIVPANTFSDPEGDIFILSATKADDSPLPAWLSFDVGTETFSGVPGHFDVAVLDIKVTATDVFGAKGFDIFELEVLEDETVKTKNLFTTFRALLPKGRAWNIDLSTTFKLVVDAIMSSAADAKDYFLGIYNDIFPDTTRSPELWEEQFLLSKTGLTISERRQNIASRWSEQGGQSVSYLEEQLAKIGIIAKVYENFNRDDPTTFLIGGDSEILINGEILFEEKDYTTSCGNPEMSCGNPEASCGAYTGFTAVAKEYPISPYPEDWVHYFIVADPASSATPLDIPANLERSFKLLILRLKPTQTRAVLNVNYV